MRNCEAIGEVLKRTSPAGRCAMPQASKPSSIRNGNRRSFEADVARRAVRDAAGIKTFVNEAPPAGAWKQHKQSANSLNNKLLYNTNAHILITNYF